MLSFEETPPMPVDKNNVVKKIPRKAAAKHSPGKGSNFSDDFEDEGASQRTRSRTKK